MLIVWERRPSDANGNYLRRRWTFNVLWSYNGSCRYKTSQSRFMSVMAKLGPVLHQLPLPFGRCGFCSRQLQQQLWGSERHTKQRAKATTGKLSKECHQPVAPQRTWKIVVLVAATCTKRPPEEAGGGLVARSDQAWTAETEGSRGGDKTQAVRLCGKVAQGPHHNGILESLGWRIAHILCVDVRLEPWLKPAHNLTSTSCWVRISYKRSSVSAVRSSGFTRPWIFFSTAAPHFSCFSDNASMVVW